MDNTISVNEFGDGDCWNAIFEKLTTDLKGHAFQGIPQSMVTTVFNIAHELGYKLVKHDGTN